MVANGTRTQHATLSRPDTGSRPPPLRVGPGRWGRGRLALLGLVAVLTVLALTLLVSRAGARTPVLVMLTDVPYAATITDADVGTAWVAVDPGVATVPANQRDVVIGQTATTTLHRGQLLTPGATGTDVAPAAGQVLIGLPVPGGRMPAGGLEAGDSVLVVPAPSTPGGEVAGEPVPASVVRVGEADLDGARVVDVTVPTGQGPALARAAASGSITLLLLPAGGG
jgi:hypothetical protein